MNKYYRHHPLQLIIDLRFSSVRQRSLARLVECGDLPGDGWIKDSDVTAGMPVLGERTAFGTRVHGAGYMSAARMFEHSSSQSWISVQVGPFWSSSEAPRWLSDFAPRHVLRDPTFSGARRSEREIEPPVVPGTDASRWIVQESDYPKGPGHILLVAATVDANILKFDFSRPDRPWDETEALPLISLQAKKVRDGLLNESGAVDGPGPQK